MIKVYINFCVKNLRKSSESEPIYHICIKNWISFIRRMQITSRPRKWEMWVWRSISDYPLICAKVFCKDVIFSGWLSEEYHVHAGGLLAVELVSLI